MTLKDFGYAPGFYCFHCIDCPKGLPLSEQPMADKRSWRCEKHAQEALDAYLAKPKTVRVIGIDPSLTATGWVIADVDVTKWEIVDIIEMGLSETSPAGKKSKTRVSSDNVARARKQRCSMTDAIETHRAQIACSEVPSGAQSAKAALAFGIVIGLLAALPIPMVEVTPTQVKVAACDDKTADKEDIMRWALDMTRKLGGLAFWKTAKKPNEFEIELDGQFLIKKMEHQADAVAVVQAALRTPEFRQIARKIVPI